MDLWLPDTLYAGANDFAVVRRLEQRERNQHRIEITDGASDHVRNGKIEPEDDQPEWLVKINNSQIAGAFGLEEE